MLFSNLLCQLLFLNKQGDRFLFSKMEMCRFSACMTRFYCNFRYDFKLLVSFQFTFYFFIRQFVKRQLARIQVMYPSHVGKHLAVTCTEMFCISVRMTKNSVTLFKCSAKLPTWSQCPIHQLQPACQAHRLDVLMIESTQLLYLYRTNKRFL